MMASDYVDADGYGLPSPPIIIGGPTGDYEVIADVPDCRWAEYRVLLVTNGDVAGAAAVIVSDKKPNGGLKYDGTVTLNKQEHPYGQAIRLAPTITQPLIEDFIRIVNSERKVFIRIDAQSNCSAYVTLQFRPKLLLIIPGPSHEIHPDHMEKLNQARAEKTIERLQEMGVPGYAQEGLATTNKGT